MGERCRRERLAQLLLPALACSARNARMHATRHPGRCLNPALRVNIVCLLVFTGAKNPCVITVRLFLYMQSHEQQKCEEEKYWVLSLGKGRESPSCQPPLWKICTIIPLSKLNVLTSRGSGFACFARQGKTTPANQIRQQQTCFSTLCEPQRSTTSLIHSPGHISLQAPVSIFVCLRVSRARAVGMGANTVNFKA